MLWVYIRLMGTVIYIADRIKPNSLVKLQDRLSDGKINFVEFMDAYTRLFGDDDMGELYNPFDNNNGVKNE